MYPKIHMHHFSDKKETIREARLLWQMPDTPPDVIDKGKDADVPLTEEELDRELQKRIEGAKKMIDKRKELPDPDEKSPPVAESPLYAIKKECARIDAQYTQLRLRHEKLEKGDESTAKALIKELEKLLSDTSDAIQRVEKMPFADPADRKYLLYGLKNFPPAISRRIQAIQSHVGPEIPPQPILAAFEHKITFLDNSIDRNGRKWISEMMTEPALQKVLQTHTDKFPKTDIRLVMDSRGNAKLLLDQKPPVLGTGKSVPIDVRTPGWQQKMAEEIDAFMKRAPATPPSSPDPETKEKASHQDELAINDLEIHGNFPGDNIQITITTRGKTFRYPSDGGWLSAEKATMPKEVFSLEPGKKNHALQLELRDDKGNTYKATSDITSGERDGRVVFKMPHSSGTPVRCAELHFGVQQKKSPPSLDPGRKIGDSGKEKKELAQHQDELRVKLELDYDFPAEDTDAVQMTIIVDGKTFQYPSTGTTRVMNAQPQESFTLEKGKKDHTIRFALRDAKGNLYTGTLNAASGSAEKKAILYGVKDGKRSPFGAVYTEVRPKKDIPATKPPAKLDPAPVKPKNPLETHLQGLNDALKNSRNTDALLDAAKMNILKELNLPQEIKDVAEFKVGGDGKTWKIRLTKLMSLSDILEIGELVFDPSGNVISKKTDTGVANKVLEKFHEDKKRREQEGVRIDKLRNQLNTECIKLLMSTRPDIVWKVTVDSGATYVTIRNGTTKKNVTVFIDHENSKSILNRVGSDLKDPRKGHTITPKLITDIAIEKLAPEIKPDPKRPLSNG